MEKEEVPDYTIKSAYKYFDETTGVWNLFLFIEYCTIYFCLHRCRKHLERFTTNNFIGKYDRYDSDKIEINRFDNIYAFETKNDVNKSIYNLKQNFNGKLKKQTITKTLNNKTKAFLQLFYIKCLGLAFIKNPQNIIQNGLKSDENIIVYEQVRSLKEELYCEYNKYICVIINRTLFIDAVNRFINDKYDNIYSSCWDDGNYCCDIEGCDFESDIDGEIYFCYNCYMSNNVYNLTQNENIVYNLCLKHLTEENINKHALESHWFCCNKECKFLKWNEEFDNQKLKTRIDRCY